LKYTIQVVHFCAGPAMRVITVQRRGAVIFPAADFIEHPEGQGKGIGFLDGTQCVLEWKTTSSRYAQEPEGLLALDPQLVCYSWLSGIQEVSQVVFVRKRLSKSSTCAPQSQKRSARNLANW
jgi:hypothetical protein